MSQYVPVKDPSISTLTGCPADSSSDGSSPYSCQQPIRASFSLLLLRLAEDVNRAPWFTCSSSRSWTPHGSRNLNAADDWSHTLITHKKKKKTPAGINNCKQIQQTKRGGACPWVSQAVIGRIQLITFYVMWLLLQWMIVIIRCLHSQHWLQLIIQPILCLSVCWWAGLSFGCRWLFIFWPAGK